MEARSICLEEEQQTTYSNSCRDFVYNFTRSAILRVQYGMMATVQEYFIVPKDVYEKCHAPEESLQDKFDKLPKKAKSKSANLLEFLNTKLQWDSQTGTLSGLSESIYNYINYSVRGKQRPIDWKAFLPNLLTAPQGYLCEKVKREIKRYKRQHGRYIRETRLE